MLAHRSNYSQKAHVLQFLHLQIIPGDCYFKASLTGSGRNYCLNPVCRWMLMSSWCSSRTLLWYWMINCFKWYQISFSKEQFFNWLNRSLKVKLIGDFFQVAISSTKHITTSFWVLYHLKQININYNAFSLITGTSAKVLSLLMVFLKVSVTTWRY